MFGIFKRKSEMEVLQKKYTQLLSEAHKLSHISRQESDRKMAEAEAISTRIEILRQNKT